MRTSLQFILVTAGAALLVCSLVAPAHGQITQQWLTQWGTSSADAGSGVAVDGAGRTWVSGYTQGALGGTSAGGWDLILTPLSATGARGTSVQRGSNDTDIGYAVAVVGGNTVFGVGYTQSTTAWDGGAPIGSSDALTVGYSTAGAWQSTTRFGSSGQDFIYAAAGNATNLLTAGLARGTIDGQAWAGANDAFLSKRTATGALVWTRVLGTSTEDVSKAAAFDSAGNAYMAGYTLGSLPGFTNTGSYDLFVACYDASGNRTLLKQFGTSAGELAYDMEVDGSGNIYLTGETQGALGGQTKLGASDAFLTKLDSSGTVLWTRLLGGTATDVSNALALDAAGNVWIGGNSSSAFAGHTNAGTNDAFVARYDSAGTLLDTLFWDSTGQEGVNGLAAAADGSVSVSGTTTGTLGAASAGDFDAWAASVTTVPVPEPTAALLLGLGLPALLGFSRPRRFSRLVKCPANS